MWVFENRVKFNSALSCICTVGNVYAECILSQTNTPICILVIFFAVSHDIFCTFIRYLNDLVYLRRSSPFKFLLSFFFIFFPPFCRMLATGMCSFYVSLSTQVESMDLSFVIVSVFFSQNVSSEYLLYFLRIFF